jgi:hypothetical protein
MDMEYFRLNIQEIDVMEFELRKKKGELAADPEPTQTP